MQEGDGKQKKKLVKSASRSLQPVDLEELQILEPYPDIDFRPNEIYKQQWLWPEEGTTKFSIFYTYWLLAHCIYY